jgi:hypothetical protein
MASSARGLARIARERSGSARERSSRRLRRRGRDHDARSAIAGKLAHPPVDEAPPEAPAPPDAVTMNFDDTEAALLLRALGEVVQKPVKVDPAAQPLVDCAVVTMRAGRVSPAAAVAAVTAALRPKGLVVAETAGAVDVRRAPDAAPCPGKH